LRRRVRLNASPPARPTSATPPAAAGAFAFSANAASFDLSVPLLLVRLVVRFLAPEDGERRLCALAPFRLREFAARLLEPVDRLFVPDDRLLEPVDLLFEPDERLFELVERLLLAFVWAICGPPCSPHSPGCPPELF
jgi:hypothetical protein